MGIIINALCVAESRDAGYSFFDFPTSPPHTAAAGAGVSKETVAPQEPTVPLSGPVRDPPLEKTVETTAGRIFDTVDSSDNLISPNEGDGLDLRFSDAGKQKSDAEVRQQDAEPQKSPAGEKGSGSSAGGAGYDGPPIQPGSLNWSITTAHTLRVAVWCITDPPGLLCRGTIFLMTLRHARRFWVVWAPLLKSSAPVPHPESCV
ncbi:hypothetical protein HanHA300_Chr07g0258441 [Helianthus annuus]|nr:hypothetical protein HanHA300_Chr07g0258441 [Helianthus annuus]KAJ0564521.1 hypothetical protein HanHA89_Chr07g0275231 [Helianthus annuus]KAJ0729837.1 hypothetical protein HanLR1_Chr07g0257401 [Helianthus annuus]KAJ0732577.1 hypothetical protein HanOQP8_Chr07g0264771 [Helianthus annuus]